MNTYDEADSVTATYVGHTYNSQARWGSSRLGHKPRAFDSLQGHPSIHPYLWITRQAPSVLALSQRFECLPSQSLQRSSARCWRWSVAWSIPYIHPTHFVDGCGPGNIEAGLGGRRSLQWAGSEAPVLQKGTGIDHEVTKNSVTD